MYTIERYHDISMGHRVFGHESKCAHFHGHNYRITFTCTADPNVAALDNIGRIIDFGVIKEKLCMWLEDNWDHKFLMWKQDPDYSVLYTLDPNGVVAVDFNPTAENMAEYLVNTIGPKQLQGTWIRVINCKVEETRKCSASFKRTDNV